MGKSGGGGSQTQKWSPNKYQETLLGDYRDPTSKPNTVLGNLMGDNGYMASSNQLREGSMGLLNNYLGSDLAKFDFGNANNVAQGYIGVGQNNLQDLANGNLSSGIMQNISDTLMPEYQRNVGGMITGYGDRGVLGSSLTQASLFDSNKAYAQAQAQQAQNWMGTLGNANTNLIGSAPANISTAGAAQDAATASGLGLLNAGIGSFNTAQSVLGQGGDKTTSNNAGSMHGGDYLNMGLQVAGMFFCFPAETGILMEDGTNKPIADVKVGDYVMTLGDGEYIEGNKVLEIQEPREEKLFKVVCIDSLGAECPVEASATQPFMDVYNNWIELKDLKVGDVLLGVGKVKSIEPTRIAMVYDLRVEKNNNYIADGFVAKGKPAKEVIE